MPQTSCVVEEPPNLVHLPKVQETRDLLQSTEEGAGQVLLYSWAPREDGWKVLLDGSWGWEQQSAHVGPRCTWPSCDWSKRCHDFREFVMVRWAPARVGFRLHSAWIRIPISNGLPGHTQGRTGHQGSWPMGEADDFSNQCLEGQLYHCLSQ